MPGKRGGSKGGKKRVPPKTVRSQPPNPSILEVKKEFSEGILVQDDTYLMPAPRFQHNPSSDIKSVLPILAPGAFTTAEDYRRKMRSEYPEVLKEQGFVNFDSQHEEMKESMEELKKTPWLQKLMEKKKALKKPVQQIEPKPVVAIKEGGQTNVQFGNLTAVFSNPPIPHPQLTEMEYHHLRRPALDSEDEEEEETSVENITSALVAMESPRQQEVTSLPPVVPYQPTFQPVEVGSNNTADSSNQTKRQDDKGPLAHSSSVDKMTVDGTFVMTGSSKEKTYPAAIVRSAVKKALSREPEVSPGPSTPVFGKGVHRDPRLRARPAPIEGLLDKSTFASNSNILSPSPMGNPIPVAPVAGPSDSPAMNKSGPTAEEASAADIDPIKKKVGARKVYDEDESVSSNASTVLSPAADKPCIMGDDVDMEVGVGDVDEDEFDIFADGPVDDLFPKD